MILPHTNITPIPTLPKPAATPSLWNTRQTEIDENFAAVKAAVEAGDTGLTNHLADTVDAHDASAISNVPSGNLAATNVQAALNELQTDVDSRILTSAKDATGGVVGMTLFKINFKNALNTFTSFFTNANTAARTYTFQDRDGTIADNTDLALKAPLASPALTGNPTAPTQALGTSNTTLANTAFVQAAIAALSNTGDYKASVRVATTAAINLAAPGASIDGVAMVVGDRFLDKDNATLAARGIYIWNGAAVAATRAADADNGAEFNSGAIIPVEEGTVNGNTNWQLTTGGTVTIGSTGLTFQRIAPESSPVLPGTVINFASATAPAGYLKANGAAISRSTYVALFAAIGTTFGVGDGATTFNLPDLRGEFIRGWDDGRGVDAARTFGSAQADQFKSHNHVWTVAMDRSPGTSGNAVFGDEPTYGTQDIATTYVGGNETRPRNIALLACIKY